MPIRLDIVTPEKKEFSAEVDGVEIPGIEGELGVLPNHAALVTTLMPGELRYKRGGEEVALAVGEGIVEVQGESVAVLTDLAVGDADIDEKIVEDALKRAEDRLKEIPSDQAEEMAAMQAVIAKSIAQLQLKRKKRGG